MDKLFNWLVGKKENQSNQKKTSQKNGFNEFIDFIKLNEKIFQNIDKKFKKSFGNKYISHYDENNKEKDVQKVEIIKGDKDLDKYDFWVNRSEDKLDTEPKDWDEYIGQEEIKKQIQETLHGIKKDKSIAYPHILISGNAGYGKSSLIHLLANKTDFPLIETVAGNLEDKEDVYELLSKLPKKFPYGIIFIDEIHGLDKKTGEILLPVVQTFKVNNKPIPYFTLAGATTDLGLLNKKLSPLVDRCKQKFILEPYTNEQLATIIKNQADKRDLTFTHKALLEIASRSRETPRLALGYLDNMMYHAKYKETHRVTVEMVRNKMEKLKVYENGITQRDINLLKYLNKQEKPVGQNALTQVLNVDKLTYNNTIEPFLVRKEMITRTPRGRVIGETGKEYLKQLEKKKKE